MTTTALDERPALWDRPLAEWLTLSWEKVLYAVLLVTAFFTRFYDLGTRVMSHDESLHTQFAWYLANGRGFQHSPLMHGVLRFELTAFTYWLLGDNDFTARIPTALMGVLAVGLMWFFRPWLGKIGAFLAALMLLISPYMLYYSRYIRDEPYMIVWGILTTLMIFKYMARPEAKYLYGLSVVLALFYATMEASFIYIAIFMLFLGLHLLMTLVNTAWPNGDPANYRGAFQIATAIGSVAVLVALMLVAADQAELFKDATAVEVPAAPAAGFAALSGLLQVAVGLGGAGVLAFVVGAGIAVNAFRVEIKAFPAFNLLMIFGVFVLPQLTAVPVYALGRNPTEYNLPSELWWNSDAFFSLIFYLLFLAVSIGLGLWWDVRIFLIAAGLFYGLYIPMFTTFFTNGGGLLSGPVGSLGYWLEQHGVQRGSQPLYYYALINLPIYEFLPTLGALFALGVGLYRLAAPRFAPASDDENAGEAAAPPSAGFPAPLYLGFWGVMALVGFSIAGEKMPWLTTHITLPLIMLSGWAIGLLAEAVDWRIFREREGWLMAAILPVLVLALANVLGSWLGPLKPFSGSDLEHLQVTGVFVSAFIVLGICGTGVYFLLPRVTVDHTLRLAGLWVFAILGLFTARAAFIAAYVNYDYANEFLVYAHGARGVKTVLTQIEDLSQRTADGYGMKVAYDDSVAWPMTWYFRDFTNQAYYGSQPTREQLDAPVVVAGPTNWSKVESILGDRYYQFEYIRMVWPMQDYFGLTDVRVSNALTNPQYRLALWNIWLNRDYTLYGTLTGGDFALSKWPVSERMRMYVRKDIAAQIWDYGVGPTQLDLPVAEDPYIKNKQIITAQAVWGSEGSLAGQFSSPRGVATGPDGSVFVADSKNHRVQKFAPTGELLLTIGEFGSLDTGTAVGGRFNEPWAVAVAADGSFYVADTWNHRIQKFDANGNFLLAWGRFGNDGGMDALWGPRAVAVDAEGRVYVADTGNKRVVVYSANGQGLSIIGSGGIVDPGLLDEPVGVAVGPDGDVYVADTWNQRVQVFRETVAGSHRFTYNREWSVEAWFGQSLDNKPYLAVDAQNRVYTVDPEGYRVLVFDQTGQFITTWGDYGADDTTIGMASGVAVDVDGNVYVTDSGNQRLMAFPPIK